MPPPYFTSAEEGIILPMPRVLRYVSKVGLVVYAAMFAFWLVRMITS